MHCRKSFPPPPPISPTNKKSSEGRKLPTQTGQMLSLSVRLTYMLVISRGPGTTCGSLICHLWLFFCNMAPETWGRKVGKTLLQWSLWLTCGSHFETAVTRRTGKLQASLRCKIPEPKVNVGSIG